MKRLTTDTPSSNFETMLNFVYGKDGWAWIRDGGEDREVLLTQWAKEHCIARGCDELAEYTDPQEIDEAIGSCIVDFADCPFALAYTFACQAVHLRSRLKMYEDVLYDADGKELIAPEDITTGDPFCVFYCNRRCNLDGDWCAEGPGCPHELDRDSAKRLLESSQQLPNDPLTMEKLREMDGEQVWLTKPEEHDGEWAIVRMINLGDILIFCPIGARRKYGELGTGAMGDYGKTWLAYRRKTEEERHE